MGSSQLSPRLTDKVQWARFAKTAPNFAIDKRRRGAKGRGIRYEKAVQKYLQSLFGGWYITSPWLMYCLDDQKRRWCQPDGLIVRPDKGRIIVQETKLQHCSAAYFQLEDLYYPVLRTLFPETDWDIRMLEICKWYDPEIPFPGNHHLRPHPYQVQANEIGVLIWNPRRT